jgi:hypothetical protein
VEVEDTIWKLKTSKQPVYKCRWVGVLSAVRLETVVMYYLKHELERFIRYKTRGAAERLISDKTWQRVFWIA